MDSTDSSPPVSRCFPRGLRVLAVDRDPDALKLSVEELQKCNYGVTPCSSMEMAFQLLQERMDSFDVVICDVKAIDRVELLEHIGLQMNFPVIMTLANEELTEFMQRIKHGACAYILKPVKMEDLRNISQYVGQDEGFSHSEDIYSGGKRKDSSDVKQEQGCNDVSSRKKPRVVWTEDLHNKFLKAMEQIGPKIKVGPKKILDLMEEPGLTREHVASHLQKYRLYMSRKEQEVVSDEVMNQSKGNELSQNVDLQESIVDPNSPTVATQTLSSNSGIRNAQPVPAISLVSEMMDPQHYSWVCQVAPIQQFEPLHNPCIDAVNHLVEANIGPLGSHQYQPWMMNCFGSEGSQYMLNTGEELEYPTIGNGVSEYPVPPDGFNSNFEVMSWPWTQQWGQKLCFPKP